ncbi:MAG TPA: thiamine diphosphokinase [Firmicutes bacterium]|nr:thiamine diphosphokinase [Bacillota bacterium]
MKRCIILAAYKIENEKIPLDIISKGDFIICADGGRCHAEKMGIIPDVILGDFDSSPEMADGDIENVFSAKQIENLDDFNNRNIGAKLLTKPEIIRLPAEKDDTDTAAAIKLGLDRGCREFYIFGGIGGRIDHTIGNIVLLKYLADNGCRGIIVGDNAEMSMIKDGSVELKRKKYKYLSVLAFGGDAESVTLSGVKYPLQDYNLANNYPLGVSNEITEDTAQISVNRGTLLIIQTME